MIYLQIFWVFLITNILGYGGGPATIPLIQKEVVSQHGWMTNEEFADLLAVANALPGPIATKLGAFIGYGEAGWIGLIIASIATIAPSAIAIVLLLKLLNQFNESLTVKGMTLLVQPVIAILMVQLTWQFGIVSLASTGIVQSIIIAGLSLLAIQKWKIHPALVIVSAFAYGAVIMPLF